jgi:hypothetical protein
MPVAGHALAAASPNKGFDADVEPEADAASGIGSAA